VSTAPADAPSGPARPRAAPAEARIAVTCFGPFRVTIDDRPVERWESVRARTIFKYLVVRSSAPVSKELLAELFWPESEPDLARRSLHQAIYCLRQSLKRVVPDLAVIRYVDGCYQISPEAGLWVDSEAFTRLIGEARAAVTAGDHNGAMVAYATAADLMRGSFLEEERYEAWAEELRQTYRAMYSEALHRLSRHYLGRGEHATAVLYAQRVLNQEPCDEEAHLLLMRSYIAQGLRHLAVRQYQICTNALRTELGLTPSPEIERFYRQVLASE
jgi:DNA-binding SARP family transcriptional activator